MGAMVDETAVEPLHVLFTNRFPGDIAAFAPGAIRCRLPANVGSFFGHLDWLSPAMVTSPAFPVSAFLLQEHPEVKTLGRKVFVQVTAGLVGSVSFVNSVVGQKVQLALELLELAGFFGEGENTAMAVTVANSCKCYLVSSSASSSRKSPTLPIFPHAMHRACES